ncbi:acetyltransferase [Legionella antarctica]|uniref:Acetyltransferase n=1 Tax=Legionella antarctica TaxID=2708020 RepID=A0A6F8T379_9GAMM|nr:acetyltransferase [Legionella antarctica]BCA94921.1 acetyltransferase [Legionella antarctica]
MHTNQLKIVGCGGHSKVVIDALSLCKHSFQISLCDSNKDLLGKELSGLLIDSTMESLADFDGFIHVAIGNNQVRKSIYKLINLKTGLFTVIHPAAVISKLARIENGSFIAARAILGPESYIGEGCIVNHGAVVDHEVKIGSYSHIAPNSTLGGNVTVGEGVLVGSGAVILPGITIGDGAIIAAGAVVIQNVKENTLVKGVPAV